MQQNGGFIVPWGRIGALPPNIEKGLHAKEDGGSGIAQQFVTWCDKETKPYM